MFGIKDNEIPSLFLCNSVANAINVLIDLAENIGPENKVNLQKARYCLYVCNVLFENTFRKGPKIRSENNFEQLQDLIFNRIYYQINFKLSQLNSLIYDQTIYCEVNQGDKCDFSEIFRHIDVNEVKEIHIIDNYISIIAIQKFVDSILKNKDNKLSTLIITTTAEIIEDDLKVKYPSLSKIKVIQENIHDRRITFDNDVFVILGRGLDYVLGSISLATDIFVVHESRCRKVIYNEKKPPSTQPQPQASAPTQPQPQASAPTQPQAQASAPTQPQSSAPTQPQPQASAPTQAQAQASAPTQPQAQASDPTQDSFITSIVNSVADNIVIKTATGWINYFRFM